MLRYKEVQQYLKQNQYTWLVTVGAAKLRLVQTEIEFISNLWLKLLIQLKIIREFMMMIKGLILAEWEHFVLLHY